MNGSVVGDTITKSKVVYKPPKKYKIVIYNDDRTTMEYVVTLLVMVFKKGMSSAIELMLKVHTEGLAIVGVYPQSVAEELMKQATDFKVQYNKEAKKSGEDKPYYAYLKIKMEEE